MSAAAAPHPRSSMLCHLVIIGNSSPDERPRYQFVVSAASSQTPKARAKRGPRGAAVEIQEVVRVDDGPRGEIGWNTRWPDPKLEALLSR